MLTGILIALKPMKQRRRAALPKSMRWGRARFFFEGQLDQDINVHLDDYKA